MIKIVSILILLISIKCINGLNGCDPNPCLNSMNCLKLDEQGGFECLCGHSYYGELCNHALPESANMCIKNYNDTGKWLIIKNERTQNTASVDTANHCDVQGRVNLEPKVDTISGKVGHDISVPNWTRYIVADAGGSAIWLSLPLSDREAFTLIQVSKDPDLYRWKDYQNRSVVLDGKPQTSSNLYDLWEIYHFDLRCLGKEPSDVDVCSGHGACLTTDFCVCDHVGYTGRECEFCTTPDFERDEFGNCSKKMSCGGINYDIPQVCGGVGNCTANDFCVCDDPLYYGLVCDQLRYKCNGVDFDNTTVCNGGTCYGEDQCACTEDWLPPFCTERKPTCNGINHDNSSVCSTNGGCVNSTCICKSGYNGTDCENEQVVFSVCNGVSSDNENVCSGNGVCGDDNICVCNDPYYGNNCNKETFSCWGISETNSTVCNGAGECVYKDVCSCSRINVDDQCVPLQVDNQKVEQRKLLYISIGIIGLILLLLVITTAVKKEKERNEPNYEKPQLGVIIAIVLGFLDLFTDCIFTYGLFNQGLKTLGLISLIFLSITILGNLYISHFEIWSKRQLSENVKRFQEWLKERNGYAKVAVSVLFSISNIDNMRLLNSHLSLPGFGRFDCPVSDDYTSSVQSWSVFSRITEDIPQMVIVILYLGTDGAIVTEVEILTLTLSVLSLLFAMLRSCSIVSSDKKVKKQEGILNELVSL